MLSKSGIGSSSRDCGSSTPTCSAISSTSSVTAPGAPASLATAGTSSAALLGAAAVVGRPSPFVVAAGIRSGGVATGVSRVLRASAAMASPSRAASSSMTGCGRKRPSGVCAASSSATPPLRTARSRKPRERSQACMPTLTASRGTRVTSRVTRRSAASARPLPRSGESGEVIRSLRDRKRGCALSQDAADGRPKPLLRPCPSGRSA